MDHIRSVGAMVITSPSECERVHELAVRLTREEAIRLDLIGPQWLTLHANIDTNLVACKLGRLSQDDGA